MAEEILTEGTVDFITDPKDASKGSFNSIKRMEGDLVSCKKVAGKFGDQLEIVLTGVTILEMLDATPEPELKDGSIRRFIKYAKAGQVPSKNSFFAKYFLPSAQKAGVDLKAVNSSPKHVIMEWVVDQPLFTSVDQNTGEEAVHTASGWTFVNAAEATPSQADADAIARALVLGLALAPAKRALMMDNRLKSMPEYTQALDAGTLATKLGIAFVDGKFAEVVA